MNLWADIDHNEQEQSRTGTVTRRTRRLTEWDVLSSVREWLVEHYLPAYCRSLIATRIFRRCYWIDALGLETRALSSQSNGAGKPAALQPFLSLTNSLKQEHASFQFSALLFAPGKRKHTAQPLTLSGKSALFQLPWPDAAPTILQQLEQSPALFLLNPLSPNLFRYEQLVPLFRRTAPTELCLLISHQQVTALMQTAQHSSEVATQLKDLLRSDRWKTLPPAKAVSGFLTLFMAVMKRHFSFPIQRIPVLMQVGPAHVAAQPYTLLFATRRQDSLLCMNDAISFYRQHLYRESCRGVLGEEWFLAQEQERRATALQQLYEETLHLGREQRVRRWPDLRQQLCLSHFGHFSQAEYNEIIQKLLLNKAVYCEWRRSGAEQQRTALPGNEDVLLWHA